MLLEMRPEDKSEKLHGPLLINMLNMMDFMTRAAFRMRYEREWAMPKVAETERAPAADAPQIVASQDA